MRIEILVRNVREEKNITIQKLSQISGLSKGHLSRIERGETEPTISTLIRIALVLKVDVKELYKIVF